MIKDRYSLPSFNADNRIPDLINEITRCSVDIKCKLGELPPLIETPRSSLHNLCLAFERELKEQIEGEFNKNQLVVMIAEADKEFLKDIKFSIAKFGLVDHDEEKTTIMKRCANDFLFEIQRISRQNVD